MKRNLLLFGFVLIGLGMFAQTPRLSLVEEFTGENCPPCALNNPAFNTLLSQPTNTAKVVAIKWQVPIPSAPSAAWSLYQTNKAEIDWRWRSVANGGYGYTITSAPSVRIDGQHPTTFGAAGQNITQMNSNVFSTAQSYTSAFSISMEREWDATLSSVNLTVNIEATADFNAVGNLVFRTVMLERLIVFSSAPGTNGEKKFEDVAIKSFPTLQGGVAMASSWTVGQTQTFTLNCPIPSYTRKKEEIAFVGLIQDDGNKKVAQAVRLGTQGTKANDAEAVSISVPSGVICTNTLAPEVRIRNNGSTTISSMIVTPYVGSAAKAPTSWSGTLNNGASITLTLDPFSIDAGGGQELTYEISGVSGTDANILNNYASTTIFVGSASAGSAVSEGFVNANYPPANWAATNADNGPAWSRHSGGGGGGFALSQESSKYNFFENTVIGDKDELYMPTLDLSGTEDPQMYFDFAYAQRNFNSNDMLEIFASDDCGSTWTKIYSNQGADMSTSSTGPMITAFVPGAADWRTEMFPLNGFNKSNVVVKFVVTNDNGNNLYLDNINLMQGNAVGIKKQQASALIVSLYPNPTSGLTNINVQSPQAGEGLLSVTNLLGQTVHTQPVHISEGSNSLQLDASAFPTGVYHVQISTPGGSVIKKLNISK
jgi:hypothetical protein